MGKNNRVPGSTVLQFSTALARTAFFLAALSPSEFNRATETGSIFVSTNRVFIRIQFYKKIYVLKSQGVEHEGFLALISKGVRQVSWGYQHSVGERVSLRGAVVSYDVFLIHRKLSTQTQFLKNLCLWKKTAWKYNGGKYFFQCLFVYLQVGEYIFCKHQ